MDQTWRVTRSNRLITDRWIDLRADDCVTPNGAEIAPYYVLRYPDWVHVVALTPDDRLVLVRQYRHAVGQSVLELPGGMMDPADTNLEQTARRELQEETGFTAQRWQFVSSLYPNPATHTNRVHFLLATGTIRGPAQHLDEGEEGLEVSTLPISEVLPRLGAGLLGQAMHVSAVLLGLALAGRISLEPVPPR